MQTFQIMRHTYIYQQTSAASTVTSPKAEGAVLVTCRDAYLAADADSKWLGLFK